MSIKRRDLFRGAAATTVTGAATFVAAGGADAATRPTLKLGSKGPHVTNLQRKLRRAGYWCASQNGTYDQTTQQAVMAVQKMYNLTRDGICGPKTWARVHILKRPNSRTKSGNIIEINRGRQVILFVENGRVKWIFNTSTGKSSTPTPKGRWRIERQINGMRNAPLGQLWRPKYWWRGYAIHGAKSIPGYPASSGCARVSNTGMNYIWSAGLAPIGRRVWVY